MADSGNDNVGVADAGQRRRREKPDDPMPLGVPPREAVTADPAPTVSLRPAHRVAPPEPVRQLAPGADSEGKCLVVGRSISLIGRIETCEKLVVEGTVEPDMQGCRSLEVARTGVFKGDVEVETADISGVFEGSLTARQILIVRTSGRIRGRIAYGEIEIERGGTVIGEIEPRSDEGEPFLAASESPRG